MMSYNYKIVYACILGFLLSACKTVSFEEAYQTCTPADTVVTLGAIQYKIEILGKGNNSCRIKTQFLSNPNPDFEGKTMTCELDHNLPFEMAMKNLANCNGQLKKQMMGDQQSKKNNGSEGEKSESLACKSWDSWEHFMYRPHIHQQIHDGNIIWLATSGGLVKFNKDSEKYTSYTKANSVLPSNSITKIAQSSNGALWLGTDEGDYAFGLFRFKPEDDKACKQFTASNSKLPGNVITALEMDKNDKLWVGTDDGGAGEGHDNGDLAVFNPSNDWTILSKKNPYLPKSDINGFAFSKNKIAWISTKNRGLVKYNPNGNSQQEKWSTYTKNEGLKFDKVRQIAYDENDNFWVYSNRYGKKAIQTISSSGKVEKADFYNDQTDNLKGLYQSDGNAWLLSKNTIWKIEGKNNAKRIPLQELPSKFYTSFSMEGESFWIGRYKGLAQLSLNGSLKKFYTNQDYGFPAYRVKSIAQPTEESTWFGMNSRIGIYDEDGSWTYLEGKKGGLPVDPDDQDPLSIYFLHQLKGDNLLIGTYPSLFTYSMEDEKSTAISVSDPDLEKTAFLSAAKDATGNVWIASSSGLIKMDTKGNVSQYSAANTQLPSDDVYDVAIDQQNVLWVGTQEGLAKTNTDEVAFEVFKGEVAEKIEIEEVESIVIDQSNKIYFPITYSKAGGLVRYDPAGKNWKEFEIKATENRINERQHCFMEVSSQLTIDSQNRIWMGVKPPEEGSTCNNSLSGLAVYFQGRWKIFQARNSGVPYGRISHVFTDNKDRLWMDIQSFGSGDDGVKGVARFNLPEMAKLFFHQFHE